MQRRAARARTAQADPGADARFLIEGPKSVRDALENMREQSATVRAAISDLSPQTSNFGKLAKELAKQQRLVDERLAAEQLLDQLTQGQGLAVEAAARTEAERIQREIDAITIARAHLAAVEAMRDAALLAAEAGAVREEQSAARLRLARARRRRWDRPDQGSRVSAHPQLAVEFYQRGVGPP